MGARAAGLPVPAQIGIAVVATLVGVVAVVAAVWVFLSQRRRGRMPSGATLFAAGHEGKNGVGPEARHACSFLTCSSPLPVGNVLVRLLATRQGHKSKDRSGLCSHVYFFTYATINVAPTAPLSLTSCASPLCACDCTRHGKLYMTSSGGNLNSSFLSVSEHDITVV